MFKLVVRWIINNNNGGGGGESSIIINTLIYIYIFILFLLLVKMFKLVVRWIINNNNGGGESSIIINTQTKHTSSPTQKHHTSRRHHIYEVLPSPQIRFWNQKIKNGGSSKQREREREMASNGENQQQADIMSLPVEQLNMLRKKLEEV
jgi:hypothetical protein